MSSERSEAHYVLDLSSCDREPIHIPGHVQAHGALLAVRCSSREIVQVSDNVEHYLGLPVDALLGSDVLALFDAHGASLVMRACDGGDESLRATHLCAGVVAGRGPFDVLVHRLGAVLIMELEPAQAKSRAATDYYAFASTALGSLQSARESQEYCQALAESIQDFTAYDRVMIYRFAEDWSGHVVAEALRADGDVESFLGLHFPASDIPAQARTLFLRNRLRLLPDTRYSPSLVVPRSHAATGPDLDMSLAFLRGASPMYTEYLENMGARASLTIALTQKDKLWGLIACHHREPRTVDYGVRIVCELLAQMASLQLTDRMTREEVQYYAKCREVHTEIERGLAAGRQPLETLVSMMAALRALVQCDGVALVSDGVAHLLGQTPRADRVVALAAFVAAREERVFSTACLSALYPEATDFATSAGVLAIPLGPGSAGWVLWFRNEILQTTRWAGDPSKPVTVGPRGDRLTPRASFALWVETVRGQATAWTNVELEFALRLAGSITDAWARRTVELERLNRQLVVSNEELDAFAYAASHDLKEPLRGMYNYATFLRQDAAERLAPDELDKLESISRLAQRTQHLIDSLIEYAQVGRLEIVSEPVRLDDALDATLDTLAQRIAERGAIIHREGRLPTVSGVSRFFEHVFLNLLSNSLKYTHAPRPQIWVGALGAEDSLYRLPDEVEFHVLFVRDNGIGIAEAQREAVFRLFRRLHPREAYGGGTGAGLTIVRRLIERMGGRVWVGSGQAEGTTIWFTIPRAPC